MSEEQILTTKVVNIDRAKDDNSENSDKSDSLNISSIVGKYGLIKAGMYFGNFVKITSHNKKAARFNMMLMTESGEYLRRKEGSVVHTALARASFDVLDVEHVDGVDQKLNLTDVLESSGLVDLIAIRKDLIANGIQLRTHPPRVNSGKPAMRSSSASAGLKSRVPGDADELDESR